jgi:deferrochelatase/peroxidase EfeB
VSNRRSFIRGALGVTVAGVTAGALGETAFAGAASAPAAGAVAFHGPRQAGIATPSQAHATMLSIDVMGRNRAELVELLHVVTDRARTLTAGGTSPDPGISGPPTDSGVLGPDVPADRLTITLGVGNSLFDGRYGLAGRRPAGLTSMPAFPNDHLDPAQCHGDLSLQVCAENRDAVGHAVRDIARATRGGLTVKWRVDGFRSPPRPSGAPRNLLGFKDGTSNLPTDAATMDRLLWLATDAGQPWIEGGSYQVVRKIRMLVEFWDRIGITEQENLIGRRRDTGAPMDGNAETDTPDFVADPIGEATPLTSHIRLANPRTPQTADSRILRRPFNYDEGMDAVGNLDMGLLFISYQANIQAQFEATQHRLAGEPLVDYIQPVGGGYFLALPGVTGPGDFFGSSLLA